MKRMVFAFVALSMLALAGCGSKEEKKSIEIKGPDDKSVKVEVK